jgi:hypothetical protein
MAKKDEERKVGYDPKELTMNGRRIAYRWEESGGLWCVTDDGHTWVISYKGTTAPARVALRLPGLERRQGDLMAWMPGYGPSPRRIIGVVMLDPPTRLPDQRVDSVPPVRHYRAEQLRIIGGA